MWFGINSRKIGQKGRAISLDLYGDGNLPPIETARVRTILAVYLVTTLCSIPLLQVTRILDCGIILVINQLNAQILVL